MMVSYFTYVLKYEIKITPAVFAILIATLLVILISGCCIIAAIVDIYKNREEEEDHDTEAPQETERGFVAE